MKNLGFFRRAAVGLALSGAIVASGCYGRFTLTRGIYQWNHDVTDDRYLRSLIFIPMTVIYAGAAIIDACVINVMEFWSGEKVVEESSLPDGSKVKMAAAGNNAPLIVTIERPGQPTIERQYVRLSAGHFEVRDGANYPLGTVTKLGNGQYEIRTTSGRVIGTESPLQAGAAL